MVLLLFLIKFIVPMVLGICLFSKICKTKYDSEFMLKIFAISFVASLYSAFMNMGLDGQPVDDTVLRPLVEEGSKYLAITLLTTSEWFTEPIDGILIALFAGLGFGMFDLFLASFHADWLFYLKKAFLDLPMQAIIFGIFGYAVGRERFKLNQGKPYIVFNCFALAIFLHVLYNFAAKQGIWGTLAVFLLICVVFSKTLAWALEHRIRPNLEIDDSKGDTHWKEGFQ